METADLPVAMLYRRFDARKTGAAAVASLVESIREVGILNPLRVRPAQRFHLGIMTDVWEIVAGGHRHEAALNIGLETVPCIVVQDDDLRAELIMLDENLCRADLSPAERAQQTARRKAIYEELHPETSRGGNYQNGQFGHTEDQSFAAVTATLTGQSARAVRRAAERGEKVAGDVLDSIAGTRLDKGAYLDELKRLPEEEQRAKVQRALAKADVKPTKLADVPLNDFEVKEKQVAKLMSAWNAASPEARQEFLGRIDQPIMDRRFT